MSKTSMLMKRMILLALTSLFVFCGSAKDGISVIEHKSTAVVVQKQGIDNALKFINGYISDLSNSNQEWNLVEWVESSDRVTKEFKESLKLMVEEAHKVDPIMGLGFDPIIDAQDYPMEGFELDSFDTDTHYLIVRGIDWPDFKVTMKLKEENGKWLVDGCGVVNIPNDMQMER